MGQSSAHSEDQASAARGAGMEEALASRLVVSVTGEKPFVNLSDCAP